MALFSHNGRNISYAIDSAPFAEDLLLLQGARFMPEFWKHVVADLKGPGPGRIITVEWFDSARTNEQLAEDLAGLVRTLGMHAVQIVALEEAVDAVNRASAQIPSQIGGVIAYAKTVPSSRELVDAIREALRI